MREVMQLKFTRKIVTVPDHMTCIYEPEAEEGELWIAPTPFSPPQIKITQKKYTIDEWIIPGAGKVYIAFEDNAFLNLLTGDVKSKYEKKLAYTKLAAADEQIRYIKCLPWWRRLFNKF